MQRSCRGSAATTQFPGGLRDSEKIAKKNGTMQKISAIPCLICHSFPRLHVKILCSDIFGRTSTNAGEFV